MALALGPCTSSRGPCTGPCTWKNAPFRPSKRYFFNSFIKNPQTTIALTFLTRIISDIGGVRSDLWSKISHVLVVQLEAFFKEWLPDQFVLLNQMKRQNHSPKNTFYLIVGRQISFQWLQIRQVVLVRMGLQVVWIPVFHTYICQFDLHHKDFAFKK